MEIASKKAMKICIRGFKIKLQILKFFAKNVDDYKTSQKVEKHNK